MRGSSDDASFCRRETVSRCPLCGSPHRHTVAEDVDWLYGLPGRFSVVRCRDCGVGYLAERPVREDLHLYYPDDAYYAYRKPAPYSLFRRKDLVAAAWYLAKRSVLAHQYGFRHLGGSPLLAALLRLPLLGELHRKATFELGVLLHPFVEDGALLEVGCGAGMYLDLMRALGWKTVVGVDFSRKAVEQARGVLGLEVHCGDLSTVALEGGRFDAVSLSHTLEHVPDPIQFLAEIRRVMKPGARLAVVVPNSESLCARVFGGFWLGYEPPRHLVDFTRDSLRQALERAGLAVESLTTSPRGGAQVALFSQSRRRGDPRSVYTDATHRFPMRRRLAALALGLRERLECALGMPAGEELVVVARRPA